MRANITGSSTITVTIILCLLLLVPASGPSRAAAPDTAVTHPGHPVAATAAAPKSAVRHILVKLDRQADAGKFQAQANRRGFHPRGRVYGTDWYTLSIPARASPRAAAALARSLPGVVMSTVDPIITLDVIPPRDPIYKDDDDPTTKPCDPLFGCSDPLDAVDQWGLFKTGAEAAWSVNTGSASVVIAVLDSGLDIDHDDMVGKVWVNTAEIAGNGVDDDGNFLVDDVYGADFAGDNIGNPSTDNPASQDGNPDIPMGDWDPGSLVFIGDPSVGDGLDNNGDFFPDLGVFHGTFVAGIATALTDNLVQGETGVYEGMAGACWDCRIMPVRIVNAEGEGFGSDAAAGIHYATDMGARIINASWGADLDSLDASGAADVAVITEAINYAVANGVIVVASSGNSGTEAVRFPASMPNTIAVGSSNWLDRRSAFSSYAPSGEIPDNGVDDDTNGRIDDVVDVVAPGEYIWSTYVYSVAEAQLNEILGVPGVVPGLNVYVGGAGYDGTSFSTPLVSGYIGLLLSEYPDATFGQVREVLRSNATDLLDPEGVGSNLVGYDRYSGFGRLQMVIPGSLPPDPDDLDGDGLSNSLETSLGTDPLLADTDGDGLTDYEEVAWDGDDSAYTPGAEPNPLVADTDMDGFEDGMEYVAGYDPLTNGDFPVWGDINDDRKVDTVDMLLATRAALGLLTLSADQLARGDVAPLAGGQPAPNGVFNAGDVIVIQGEVLGLISLQP